MTLNPRTVSGRPLGLKQKGIVASLEKKLRTRMLAAMQEAGWQEIARTRYGQPIWHYRPAAPAAHHTRSEQETGSVQSGPESRQSQSRIVHTRSITFTCQWCHQEVTEQRYPSHTPLYCSKPACKKEAVKAKTRKRVAEWRKAHPDARKKKDM